MTPQRRPQTTGAPHRNTGRRSRRIKGVLVEVLTFAGCQETEPQRFLGSPSIRVDGCDVEPGAELRRDYAQCCRLYVTLAGRNPLPDETWLRDMLTAAR
jgi:hypothetical protein